MPRAKLSVPYYGLVSYSDSLNTQSKRIILEHAEIIDYDASLRKDIKCFKGNVLFRHGSAIMYCDSAYLMDQSQSFEAFGQVKMVQADTITIDADYLFYDGETKLARLRNNVVMRTPSTTLYTDSLDYDRVTDIGYYFNGGKIIDQQNTLTSVYGQFAPQTNDAEFHEDVILENDSTQLYTDLFFYNTKYRIGRFQGPSLIKANSGTIHSTKGVYDLNKNIGFLMDRSELVSESRKLIGDSIFFDGKNHVGEAFGDMELIDTVQKTNLYGDYGFFDNKRYYAFATSRAFAVDYSQKDSLYIGADTLELLSFHLPDSILLRHERGEDSLMREIRAYHRVRMYRSDAQAVADSMVYSSLDSVLKLYSNPIMWEEQKQLLGDTILFQFKDKHLDYVDILGQSLSVEQLKDFPDRFNQMSGGKMRAWIIDSVLKKLFVDKPVQSISYMQDESTGKYTGMNTMTSAEMLAFFKKGGVLEKALWTGKVDGRIYPMKMANASVSRLKSFKWEQEKRPISSKDIIGLPFNIPKEKNNKLLALRAISGAKAALLAYDSYHKEQEAIRKRQEEALEQLLNNGLNAKINYQYVLRQKDTTAYDETNKYLNTKWQYNPFSVYEKAKNSSTNPYTLIREKKNLTNEFSELETK